MSTAYETLELEEPAEGVLIVRLNRPQAANAINTRMGLELHALFDALAAEPARQRAVILTGQGARAFCAGGDLKERHGMSDEQWLAQHRIFERMLRAVLECPVPLIGAVNGAAVGGGCELALACDFAFAVPQARFALTEVTLGIMPGSGGTQTLPRALGARRALELLLTGRPFSSGEALEWGLLNGLHPPERLLEETLAIARRIAANAPLAVRQIKQAVHRGLQMDLATALHFEIETYNRLVPTWDRREGVSAFNEKRPPRFQGR